MSKHFITFRSLREIVVQYISCGTLVTLLFLTSCTRENTIISIGPEHQDTLWVQTILSAQDKCVSAFAIGLNGDVFAGTCDSGVYRSTDHGNIWHPANNGFTNLQIRSLATDHDQHVFAATNFGVFHSTDNGDSWTSVGLTNVSLQSLAINSIGHVFASTKASGVFRSTNSGNSWTQLQTGLDIHGAYVTMAIDTNGTIFLGGDFLYRSTNNGDSWDSSYNQSMQFVGSLAITPAGDVFAASSGGIFRSTNSGASWTKVSTRRGGPLAVNSNGHVFSGSFSYNGIRGIVRSADNGSTWCQFGQSKYIVETLVVDSTGFLFSGTQTNGVFRTRRSTLN